MKCLPKFFTTYSITVTFFCFLFSLKVSAQDNTNFKYSFELSSDNDAYVVRDNLDRFYSFGVGMKMAFRPKQFLGLERLLPKKKNFFIDILLKSEGYTPVRSPTGCGTGQRILRSPFCRGFVRAARG